MPESNGLTWEEIRKVHPWLPESSEGWHQHPKGGGWVHEDASVSEGSFIGERALVYGEAQVCGEALVYGEARVYGEALVCGEAQVYGEARVYGEALVCGEARVYGEARVCGEAQVCGEARVYGEARVCGEARVYGEARVCGGMIDRTPVLIMGSKYWIGFSRPGHIASGCIERPLAWWLENVERCAQEHGYSEKEQKEYRLHVEHIAAWMKLYGLDKEETEVAEERKD
jgi:hypothetical protein